MIKVVTYNSIDQYGTHVVSLNSIKDMIKVASPEYSPEISSFVTSMTRKPELYYTLINAVGSYEVWGPNGNGDAFPRSGLMHKSLPTDKGTSEDYGYKTFEYYANFFKNHVNKPDSPKFGEVIFSHYNPTLERVELIVGLFSDKAKDIIDKIENGENIAVSMGTKVPYDVCSICQHKAKTRAEYCEHASKYMNAIVDKDLAEKWSIKLKKIIQVGSKVFVFNDYPKFFDISHIYIGADRTAFSLGKIASQNYVNIPFQLSSEVAEAYSMDDAWFNKIADVKTSQDKFALIDKGSSIIKPIGGKFSNEGDIKKIKISEALRKALNEKINNAINNEPQIDSDALSNVSNLFPLKQILSTMVFSGIHPKQLEFQRIIIVKAGYPDIANFLHNTNTILWDATKDYEPDNNIEIHQSLFNDFIFRILLSGLKNIQTRSCLSDMLINRLTNSSLINNNLEFSKAASFLSMNIAEDKMSELATILGSFYSGLKMRANKCTYNDIENIFVKKPWLVTLLGGATLHEILQSVQKKDSDTLNTPASHFENILYDPLMTGHIKISSVDPKNLLGYSAVGAALGIPGLYIANAYNNRSMKTKGYAQISEESLTPQKALILGSGTGLGAGVISELTKNVKKVR
jgi:hypothetical protein